MEERDDAAAVRYLYGLQKFGIKLGLENIRSLLDAHGNPQDRFPSIHVAGTNGKGSTASFLASILSAAGYRTGLYTSPHLVDFTERIRIDGVPIPAARVARMTGMLRPDIDRLNATFFEATTAMAFRYFADEGVDAAVIETGLGGRLDSTNVLRPVLAIITGVDYDHMEFLGTRLEDIAFEKAGIIKQGVPVLSAAARPEAAAVVARTALERGAPLLTVDAGGMDPVLADIDRMECVVRIFGKPERIVSPLAGRHQTSNILLALRASEMLADAGTFVIPASAAVSGIAAVRQRTGLRGRIERVRTNPELVIDVAHNPGGVAALLETWTAVRPPAETHLVFGLLKTKDAGGVVDRIAQSSWNSVTAVQCGHGDALPSRELAGICSARGVAARDGGDVVEALRDVLAGMREDGHALLFGSHYIVGEWLAAAP